MRWAEIYQRWRIVVSDLWVGAVTRGLPGLGKNPTQRNLEGRTYEFPANHTVQGN